VGEEKKTQRDGVLRVFLHPLSCPGHPALMVVADHFVLRRGGVRFCARWAVPHIPYFPKVCCSPLSSVSHLLAFGMVLPLLRLVRESVVATRA